MAVANQEVPQRSPARPRLFYGYIVALAAFCMMVAIWATYRAFGVFFKPVQTEFGWTRALTSGAFSLSMFVQGLLGILVGGLTDRLGPRLVMTLCGVLLGLGYLLMSRLNSVWELYLFYGLIVGIGMSGSWIPLLSTVARWFAARRSLMTGIVLGGNGLGGLIGPPVANWLISAYKWRPSYIVLGVAALTVVVLAAQVLRRDPAQVGQLPYGEEKGQEQAATAGIPGLSLGEASRTRQFWLLGGVVFCYGYTLFTILVHIVPHATDLGISDANAANVLSAYAVLTIIGNVLLGTTGDRIGNRQVIVISFVLASAALFSLVPATEAWALYLFAAVFGFGMGGLAASESPLIARLFGLRAHGLIFGFIGLGFTLGAAAGPFLTGYIFDIRGSYQVAFVVSGAVGVLGLALTLLLRPVEGSQGKI